MLRRVSVICSAYLLLTSLATTAGAASVQPAGIEALLDLLKEKGVISAEEGVAFREKGGPASRSDIKGVIDLLRTKGTISNDEAAAFMQRLTAQPRTDKKPADAAPVQPGAEAKGATTIPNDELKPTVEVLREQGVLGTDEVAQITERIGRKWSPADEDEPLAPLDGEIEYSRTTLPKEGLLNDIAQLQRQGLLGQDEAERVRRRFLQKLSLERVTSDIGEEARREIRTQVEARVPELPEWTRRIKVSGDLRLRYEGDFFDDGNTLLIFKTDKPNEPLNVTEDRNQMRIRARLGVVAKVNDEVEAGIGLTTGNTTNPVSTNQTLGDSLNKKNFLLDLAYLKWKPSQTVTLWGGRFPNPWFCTDMVWDPDVNFDGVALSYAPPITSRTTLFMTAGAFPIQEVELSSRDKWLFGGQLGLLYRNDEAVSARFGAAFYDFENTVGRRNTFYGDTSNDYTAPLFTQKGNTYVDIGFLTTPSGTTDLSKSKNALAAGFRELNFTGALDLGYWNPVHVVLAADYVNNIGYDKADVEALTGNPQKKETEGYQFGVTVGHPDTRALGQWKLFMFYKYLEKDAVMDAFTDSDFHLGGTNAKGWITGGSLGVGKNTWLSARWLTANEISGPPLGVDIFQFDLNARF